MNRLLLQLAERGYLPDALVRLGIRRLCDQRLREEGGGGPEQQAQRYARCLEQLRHSPVAILTEAANEQHYGLPPEFFRLCLGEHLKYSCCLYRNTHDSLDQAEDAMLELYAERAELCDGQDILELGCGWGSLTLWMAAHYPRARITAVSNSHSQRQHIEAECQRRRLGNVQVITCDVNRLTLPDAQSDRCVSVEMFEHVRNYELLLASISRWLRPDGVLFVHIFAHRTLLYAFETAGEDNWMGRYFFSGGLMPAADTLHWFQRDVRLEQQWLVDGRHYQRTAEGWLANYDAHRREIRALMRQIYGADEAQIWFQRWRIFWMSCAELFGHSQGREWLVAHYRFRRRPRAHDSAVQGSALVTGALSACG